MSKVLPDNFLKRMSPKDRAQLGKAGATAAECEAAQIARTESQLQAQIIAMLERNGIFVIYQRTNKRSQLKEGTPDLLFAVDGRPVAWEVKMPGQKPRESQLEAMRAMSLNGWLCDVIRSYDDALSLFTQLQSA